MRPASRTASAPSLTTYQLNDEPACPACIPPKLRPLPATRPTPRMERLGRNHGRDRPGTKRRDSPADQHHAVAAGAGPTQPTKPAPRVAEDLDLVPLRPGPRGRLARAETSCVDLLGARP